MSVLSGFVTKEELADLKKRTDITIFEESTEDIEQEWKGTFMSGLVVTGV